MLSSAALVFARGTAQASSPSAQPEDAGEVAGTAEIWTYWSAGAARDALDATIAGFEAAYPNASIDVKTYRSGAEIQQQLSMALMGGNPPDIFSVVAGYVLKIFADAERVSPINDVWEMANAEEAFPENVRSIMSFDGNAYAVPLGMHMLNGVWYNVAIFEEYGLEEPTTWEELQEIADVLKANDIAPLMIAMGPAWPMYAWYPFLISVVGPEGYLDLGSGRLSFHSDEVRESFRLYKEYALDNALEGWSGYNWTEATQPFMEGEVAMYIGMGDWVAAFLANQGMEQESQFDFFLAPGTTDHIIGGVDSLAIPMGAPNAYVAKAFLAYCSSVEGQVTFNELKGSMAINLNAPSDFYGPIQSKVVQTIQQPEVGFLANQYSLLTPDFLGEIKAQVQKYALEPTPEVLEEVLDTLEALRLDIWLQDKWADW